MYRFIYKEHVAHAPCLPLLYRGYAEIIENGYSMPVVGWENTDPCVYLLDDSDTVVAAMILKINLDTLWINFSCVHPDHRGKGVHKHISLELEKLAKEKLNCKRITSLVHVNNTAIINASAKVGMNPTWLRMLKVLK